jgi:dCMP deaminase
VTRPDWDIYFMRSCYHTATRATCLRKHVGAVLVDSDHRILATGYNGAARGQPSCDEVGCQMVENHCVRTLHAESNALDYAGSRLAQNATLYVTVTPCWDCAKRIVNSNVMRVVYDEHYESRYGKSMDVPDYLRDAGVLVDRLDPEVMSRFKAMLAVLDVPPVPASAGVFAPCNIHRFSDDDRCVVCGLLDHP